MKKEVLKKMTDEKIKKKETESVLIAITTALGFLYFGFTGTRAFLSEGKADILLLIFLVSSIVLFVALLSRVRKIREEQKERNL